MTLFVHPDIRQAETLPTEVYTDREVHSLALDRVFARSWQFIGDIDAVKAPGHVQPFILLEGCLDEPLVLTRDLDDQLHCISNVCTHRGMLVCEHGGRASGLACRYHGRRFDLDGRFKSMPEFDETIGFPSDRDNLPRIEFGLWGKLGFASLDPGQELDKVIGPMRSRLDWLPVEEMTFDPSRSRDYVVQANWALYCDNYLEGFHIPYVHPTLNSALEYGEYCVELQDWSSLQLGIAKGGESVIPLPDGHPDAARRIAAYYFWLFPNTMFNVYPWGVSINVVRPLGPERTRISFLTYIADATRLDQGAGAGLDRVEREDEAVVEAVQTGMRARLYRRGRYSPRREQALHHFHRLLAQALTDQPLGPSPESETTEVT